MVQSNLPDVPPTMKEADVLSEAPARWSAWILKLRNMRQTRFFRQGVQMVFWRIVSLIISLASSIWVARCLGPEYLGISGMILSTVTILVMVGTLNQNSNLIRAYKNRPSIKEAEELIATAFTFRVVSGLVMMTLALPIVWGLRLSPIWTTGLIAAFPLFFFYINPPDWVLQADNNLPASRRLGAFQTMLAALLYFVFFRPGTSPGYDIVVQAVAMTLYFLIGWRIAVRGRKIQLFQPKLLLKVLPILKSGRWLILLGLLGYGVSALELPMLGYLHSIREVGIYRTATVIMAGVQSFLVMFSDLMYPRLLEWRKEGVECLWQHQKRVVSLLAIVMVPIMLLAFVVIPVFFHFSYGSAYQRAAYPCAILLSARLLGVMTRIFSSGLLTHHQDHKLVVNLLIATAFGLSLNYLFIPSIGIYAVSVTNFMTEVLILSFSLLVTWKTVVKARHSGNPS